MNKPTERVQWIRDNSQSTKEECFSWPFARSSTGHAYISVDGVSMTAGRAMCIAAKGNPSDPKHDAAHSCGNAHKGCLNPNHLSWKTHVENMADRRDHGTDFMGQKNPRAILTDLQVSIIKTRLKQGSIGNRLAKEYGVARTTIYHIKHGTRWGHILPAGGN